MCIVVEGVNIAIVHSQTFEQLTIDHNPFNSTVTGDPCAVYCIQEMSLLLVAFTGGDIGVLSLPQNQFNFHSYEIISSVGGRDIKLCSLGIEGHFISMEMVTIDESTNKELWCGCENNTIVILLLSSLSVEKTPAVSQTIRNVSGAAHIPCKVLQLKVVNTFNIQLVCALLDTGTVVCYDTALKDCLKRIPTSTGNIQYSQTPSIYSNNSPIYVRIMHSHH